MSSSSVNIAVNYNMVMDVVAIWDHIKQLHSNQEEIGEHILLELFDVAPSTKPMLGIGLHDDATSHSMFGHYCQQLVDLLDFAITSLGPSMDSLALDLQEMSKPYGLDTVASIRYMPLACQATMRAMEKLTRSPWSPKQRASWTAVLQFMGECIVSGLRASN